MRAIDSAILELISYSEALVNLAEIIGEHADNDWFRLTHQSIVIRRHKTEYNHYIYFQEYKFYINFCNKYHTNHKHIELNDYNNRTLFHIYLNGKVIKELTASVKLYKGRYIEETLTNHPTLKDIKAAIQNCKTMIEAIRTT